ncbi:hypothetical protein [Caballeronia sp. SEWSISQ10-4 2]|nr:hypothetical protein [Caballeronia sp. SEWSISQ10-4 2]
MRLTANSPLAAALAMGASGVMVGTRFALAKEIWPTPTTNADW